jgi:hypothetical protein
MAVQELMTPCMGEPPCLFVMHTLIQQQSCRLHLSVSAFSAWKEDRTRKVDGQACILMDVSSRQGHLSWLSLRDDAIASLAA